MEITDNLIDLLIQVVHNIGKRAENKVGKKLLEDLKQVHGKAGLLFKLAEVAVEQPEGVIKDVLCPKVGLETLKSLVKEYKSSGKAYQEEVHQVVRRSCGNHYRRMIVKVRCLGPEPHDRMACPLRRQRGDDLLACRGAIRLCLLPAKALPILRSGGNDRRRAAP